MRFKTSLFVPAAFLSFVVLGAGLAAFFVNYIGSSTKVPAGLICIGIGLALGLFAQMNTLKEEPFFGIPAERCTWIRGRCVSDGARTKSDLVALYLKMSETGDKNGVRVTASGTIRIFIRTDRVPYWGEEILAAGSPSIDEETGEVLFFGNMEGQGPAKFSSAIMRWRAAAIRGFKKKIDSMGKNTSGFFKALFLGVKDDLGLQERDRFQKAGCMHILALSGMHLAVLSGFLYFLIKPLAGKRLSFWFVAFCIGVYIFITGARSSLLRAGIMFTIYGAGLFFGKRGDIRSVFLLSFLILLAVSPLAVWSLSFQLSFLALAGILYLGTGIMRGTRRFLPPFVGGPISASIGAQCATAPLLALLFGAVYPGGIVTSIVLTPVVTLFLLTGIIYLITPVDALRRVLLYPMEKLYDSIMWTASKGAKVPGIETAGSWEITATWVVCSLVCAVIIIPHAVKKTRRSHRLTTTAFLK